MSKHVIELPDEPSKHPETKQWYQQYLATKPGLEIGLPDGYGGEKDDEKNELGPGIPSSVYLDIGNDLIRQQSQTMLDQQNRQHICDVFAAGGLKPYLGEWPKKEPVQLPPKFIDGEPEEKLNTEPLRHLSGCTLKSDHLGMCDVNPFESKES